MTRSAGQASRRHRLIPVWKREIDREAFARTLLLLAVHLDEKERMAHKNHENPANDAAGNKGGEDEE